MPLVSMKPILVPARRQGYAVGAFNVVDYLTTKAVIRAAEELHAPVIVQVSVKTVRFWGHATLVGWMRELADAASVPVAFHLDHCRDVSFIKGCLEAGWTSVMIDASSLPYEANLALTRQVLALATPAGVSVEAELGEIGGVEDDLAVQEAEARLVDPEKAARFCEALDLAAFAPAIGTAHGIYKSEPRIAFDRLAAIGEGTKVPLALHGGTGLADDVIQRCIGLGCAKVNISTELKHRFIDGFTGYHQAHPREYEPLKVLEEQYQQVLSLFSEKIRQFGSAGRAASV